jgi:16S rRNA C967 or C1407 C5-methylase (RsmB/RsmF family)/NOL1/NOP2/fmu family ribosome biogenesis protein
LTMFPQEFTKRLNSQKYIDNASLLKALEEPSPISIRVNPAKWRKRPSGSELVPWSGNGYYLASRPSYTLDPLFHSGCYYPQEASSMFLEEVLRQTSDLAENIKVLDLCAAPGGKSIHTSDIIGPDNLLVANESIRSRAAILAETVTKWGSGNIVVTQNDPSGFGRLSGFFDIIVVDAPCSGEGMFRSATARKEWSLANSAHCSERQKRILMNVWPALKENGIMIYSTCTFSPGENEENLKWFIEKNKAECVQIDVSAFKGISEIDFEGIFGYGFYPGKIKGEGFFISAIRKSAKQENARVKYRNNNALRPDKNDFIVAENWTNISKERLMKWGNELIGVACKMDDYYNIYANLRVVKAGIKIFSVKNNSYLPSHDLALSQQLKTGTFPTNEVSLYEALMFMRRDGFNLRAGEKGWNLLTFKGINLGFINNLGIRVNNYFPVEWRIRMELPDSLNENIIKWDIDEKGIS